MSCESNPCEALEMIGGARRIFEFPLFDAAGNAFRMSAYQARFSVTNLVNRSMSPVLVKDMDVSTEESGRTGNTVFVTLDATDTYRLRGKYLYQVTIHSPTGLIDVPFQGELIIHENIDKAVVAQFDESTSGTATPEIPVPMEYDYITSKDIADIFREIDTGSGAALL